MAIALLKASVFTFRYIVPPIDIAGLPYRTLNFPDTHATRSHLRRFKVQKDIGIRMKLLKGITGKLGGHWSGVGGEIRLHTS